MTIEAVLLAEAFTRGVSCAIATYLAWKKQQTQM